jgi:hypothetical protein
VIFQNNYCQEEFDSKSEEKIQKEIFGIEIKINESSDESNLPQ